MVFQKLDWRAGTDGVLTQFPLYPNLEEVV